MASEIKEKKKSSNWFSVDQKHWDFMMIYYKWFFLVFFLVFATVLFFEKMYVSGICMIVFAWYVAPIKTIRKFDSKLGVIRTIILYVSIVTLIISVVIMMAKL